MFGTNDKSSRADSADNATFRHGGTDVTGTRCLALSACSASAPLSHRTERKAIQSRLYWFALAGRAAAHGAHALDKTSLFVVPHYCKKNKSQASILSGSSGDFSSPEKRGGHMGLAMCQNVVKNYA